MHSTVRGHQAKACSFRGKRTKAWKKVNSVSDAPMSVHAHEKPAIYRLFCILYSVYDVVLLKARRLLNTTSILGTGT